MALASDDLPDWSAAEDVPHEAQHQSESAHEQGASPGNLHVKRVEMLNTQEEGKRNLMKPSRKLMPPWGTMSAS